jgi:lipid-binding SYLF domain-containing protein
VVALAWLAPAAAAAETAARIDADATAALGQLYASTPAAKALGDRAKGILVFPTVTRAGFLVAGQYGVGALRKAGSTAGYYNFVELSGGFQAGVEKFSFALFFMTDDALAYFERSEGYQLGVGPNLTVVDVGFEKTLDTSTARDDIYAFVYGAKGLMGGISLKGSKITRIQPD